MRPRFLFQALGLVAVLTITACASSVASTPPAPVADSPQGETQLAEPTNLPVPQATTGAAATQPAVVQAVATSRGPKLEATDPSTVNLASGQLQLVEIFRFT